jgi:hypothetical protein
MKTRLLAALAALALGTGCQQKTEDEQWVCPPFDPTTIQVAGLAGNPGCYLESSAPGQFKNHVINTDADYQALFSCPPPPIDFSKYTLLIGKTVNTSGNFLKAQRVQQDCLNYNYSVEIQQNLATVVQPIVYHVLVPKLAPGVQVSFNVQVLP